MSKTPGQVLVCKTFSFDSSHQLMGHFGKCANLHGHTYKLEVKCKAEPHKHSSDSFAASDFGDQGITADEAAAYDSSEGFVIDFYHLKSIVNALIVDKLDHAFIAMGNETVLDQLKESGAKVVVLGFRTTVENMAQYIAWRLIQAGLPIHSVRMWETPTGWAEVLAEDIPLTGPEYRTIGGCDLDGDQEKIYIGGEL